MKFIPPSDILSSDWQQYTPGIGQGVNKWLKDVGSNFQKEDITMEKITKPQDMVLGEFYLFQDEEYKTGHTHLMYLYGVGKGNAFPIGHYKFVYNTNSKNYININNDELEAWFWPEDRRFDEYGDTWNMIMQWAKVYKLDFGATYFDNFMNWNENPLEVK